MLKEKLGNSGLEISQAQENQSSQVWGVINTCSRWLLSTKGFTHWSSYYTETKIKEKLKKQKVFLITNHQTPIATITLDTKPIDYFTSEDMSCFTDPQADALYITALGVLPEYQGRGIATALMTFAEAEAQKAGIQYVRFDCLASYSELVKFYEKLGYTVKGHYVDTQDNDKLYNLMEKEIVLAKDAKNEKLDTI